MDNDSILLDPEISISRYPEIIISFLHGFWVFFDEYSLFWLNVLAFLIEKKRPRRHKQRNGPKNLPSRWMSSPFPHELFLRHLEELLRLPAPGPELPSVLIVKNIHGRLFEADPDGLVDLWQSQSVLLQEEINPPFHKLGLF